MSSTAKDLAKNISERISNGKESEDLVAVIPAGGLGGQMFPVTSGMPKALLPLNDKPLIIEILKGLDCSIFKKAIILCNEWYPMIKRYILAFQSELSIEVECKKTTKSPSKSLKELLNQNELSDPFLFHYCDIWLKEIVWKKLYRDYKDLIERGRNVSALILGSRCYDYSVGVMSLDRFNRVIEFIQKPENIIHGCANCAVALLRRSFIEDYINCSETDIFDSNGAIQRAFADKKVFGYETGDWHHFQQIRDWLQAQKKYFSHIPF